MSALSPVVLALLVALLAGAAVDFGFHAAFVTDGVALATTAYVAALVTALIGRHGGERHWSQQVPVRIPFAVCVGVGVLLILRYVVPIELPGTTSIFAGYNPYVVFGVGATLSVGLLELVFRRAAR